MAASAIDSASRIFRREAASRAHNPRERHYARKPHTNAAQPPLPCNRLHSTYTGRDDRNFSLRDPSSSNCIHLPKQFSFGNSIGKTTSLRVYIPEKLFASISCPKNCGCFFNKNRADTCEEPSGRGSRVLQGVLQLYLLLI